MDDGIDTCRVHGDVLVDGFTRTPAVQKMTQEPISPDEMVDFGAAVQAATSSKKYRTKRCLETM